MKNILKIGVFIFCLGLNLYANNNDIERILKKQNFVPKVVKTKDSGIKNFQFVIVEQEKFWIPFLSNTDSKTLIAVNPDTIFSENDDFLKKLLETVEEVKKHNQDVTDTGVLNIFKKYGKNVVDLKGKNKAKTTYFVLDVNCPYCKAEVKNLTKYLENGNVKIMLVGALGLDSAKKAANFYDGIKNKKTQKDKISYISEVFEKDFKVSDDIDFSSIINISKELGEVGLRGVPYIIER